MSCGGCEYELSRCLAAWRHPARNLRASGLALLVTTSVKMGLPRTSDYKRGIHWV